MCLYPRGGERMSPPPSNLKPKMQRKKKVSPRQEESVALLIPSLYSCPEQLNCAHHGRRRNGYR